MRRAWSRPPLSSRVAVAARRNRRHGPDTAPRTQAAKPAPPPVRHGPRRDGGADPDVPPGEHAAAGHGVSRSCGCRPRRSAHRCESLADAGYHGVTLDQLLDNWQHRIALPSKPIVVSFDDGYGSQVRNAMPILRSQHWPGVLNLEVKNLSVAGGITKARSGA